MVEIRHDQDEVQQLVDRYLARRMSSDEERAWEEHYFACDACFRTLKAAAAVRHVIRRELPWPSDVEPAAARGPSEWWRGLVPSAFEWPRVALGTATLAAAAFVAVTGWQRAARLEREVGGLRRPAPAVATVVLQEATRGTGAELRLPSGDGTALVHVNVLDPGTDSLAFRARIRDSSGAVVWEAGGLRGQRPYGTVTLVCPAAFFAAGDYVVELVKEEGAGAGVATTFRYSMKVTKD